MFDNTKKQEAEKLSLAMDAELDVIINYGPDTPEANAALKRMETLNKLRVTTSFMKRVTPDALVGAVSTLGAVLIIVVYEERHVFASKAQNFIPKLR